MRTKLECKNEHKPRHKGKWDGIQNKITKDKYDLFPREEIVVVVFLKHDAQQLIFIYVLDKQLHKKKSVKAEDIHHETIH